MVDEAKLSGPIRSTFEVLVVHLQLDVVVEKNSVDQSQLQVLQFSVYLIDLLSILLRCNGFTEIQKTIVDQTDHQ